MKEVDSARVFCSYNVESSGLLRSVWLGSSIMGFHGNGQYISVIEKYFEAIVYFTGGILFFVFCFLILVL